MSNAVVIQGELTFDVVQMAKESMRIRPESIAKISDECEAVDPNTFDWNTIDRNTWFICVNLTTNKGYYFPIAESENRDNNNQRVKEGMAYFISQGWYAYKIQ